MRTGLSAQAGEIYSESEKGDTLTRACGGVRMWFQHRHQSLEIMSFGRSPLAKGFWINMLVVHQLLSN